MRSIQPTEARKKFFSLGTMARQEPLLVTASTPFMIVPIDALLMSPGPAPIHGIEFAPSQPFRLPEPITGPKDGKSLSTLVSEGRR